MSAILRLSSARALTLGGVVTVVALLHAAGVLWLSHHLPSMDAGHGPHIDRIDLAFVNELKPVEPPVLAPRPPAPLPVAAPRPAPAASAPQDRMPEQAAQQPALAKAEDAAARFLPPEPELPTPLDAPPLTMPEPVMLAEQTPEAASAPSAAVPSVSSASELAPQPHMAAASGSASSFEWPLSTRLSYTLTGDYRGPVHGQAQVEWLRQGSRYQVHLDVNIGGGLVTRRLSSDGVLGDQGLQPRRYEEVTQMLFGSPRRRSLSFETDRIIMADGQSLPSVAQIQDTASQFVQLSWLFTTQSHRLKIGETVEVPLALPRRVDRWLYDVHAEEELDTPVGRIRAFHMKPRRLQAPAGELLVEIWFAPTLQYLPVRILIRQDAQTYVDLLLSRLPQQVASGTATR